MKCSISVVVPTYNSSAFIDETLRSCAQQTSQPDQVIVVDDASVDDTCAKVVRLQRELPLSLSIIRLPKNSGGPSRPMNIGVSQSGCSHFTILDHDDRLTVDAISTYRSMINRIGIPTAAMVSADFLTFNDRGILVHSHFQKQAVLPPLLGTCSIGESVMFSSEECQRLLMHSWCLPTKAVFARDVWLQLGGFAERYRSAWDCDFVWRVAQKYSIHVVNQVLSEIRIHPGSLASSDEVISPELIDVYKRMLGTARSREDRRLLLSRIRAEMFDLVYSSYKSRRWVKLACRGLQYLRFSLTY